MAPFDALTGARRARTRYAERMSDEPQSPEPPKPARPKRERENLFEDWAEIMPDAMSNLSGRVRVYAIWIVVATIGSILVHYLWR